VSASRFVGAPCPGCTWPGGCRSGQCAPWQGNCSLEPLTGIEPVTSSLPRKCSTPELQRLENFPAPRGGGALSTSQERPIGRAGDETRTRDVQLGRLMLYQLSYSRKNGPVWCSGSPGSVSMISAPRWGEQDSNLRSRMTADLQSAPVGHLGISPWKGSRSQWRDSNPRPADYKSAALPAELHWPVQQGKERFLPPPPDREVRIWACKCMKKARFTKLSGRNICVPYPTRPPRRPHQA
jgi:hypothetical protein